MDEQTACRGAAGALLRHGGRAAFNARGVLSSSPETGVGVAGARAGGASIQYISPTSLSHPLTYVSQLKTAVLIECSLRSHSAAGSPACPGAPRVRTCQRVSAQAGLTRQPPPHLRPPRAAAAAGLCSEGAGRGSSDPTPRRRWVTQPAGAPRLPARAPARGAARGLWQHMSRRLFAARAANRLRGGVQGQRRSR